MGFHINKKVADKKATTGGAKNTVQASSSKFIAKASTKSTGVSKKPIKTGGSRGSWSMNCQIIEKRESANRVFPFLGLNIIHIIKILYDIVALF